MTSHLERRYLLPEPRNALAEAVLQYATAAMDVSDGLAGDLAKLCRASAVAADIDVARVPLSEAAQAVIASARAYRNGAHRRRRLRDRADAAAGEAIGLSRRGGTRRHRRNRDRAYREGEGARFECHGKPLTFKRASYSHF